MEENEILRLCKIIMNSIQAAPNINHSFKFKKKEEQS